MQGISQAFCFCCSLSNLFACSFCIKHIGYVSQVYQCDYAQSQMDWNKIPLFGIRSTNCLIVLILWFFELLATLLFDSCVFEVKKEIFNFKLVFFHVRP